MHQRLATTQLQQAKRPATAGPHWPPPPQSRSQPHSQVRAMLNSGGGKVEVWVSGPTVFRDSLLHVKVYFGGKAVAGTISTHSCSMPEDCSPDLSHTAGWPACERLVARSMHDESTLLAGGHMRCMC